MLTLRGHHLLCLPRFRGSGYSQAFTDNMWRIINTLKKEPQQVVRLTDTADDICASCPHRTDSACALEDEEKRVHKRDLQVLTLLGLESGACVPYVMVHKQLHTMMNRPLFKKTCHGCRWVDLCLGFAETKIP